MGYRFRLNVKDLPGKPDIVLPKYKNGHLCPRLLLGIDTINANMLTLQKAGLHFGRKKFADNVARFKIVKKELKHLHWNVLVIGNARLNPMQILQVN